MQISHASRDGTMNLSTIGMAVVNKINKPGNRRTCNDYAKAFVYYLILESKKCNDVRSIFDRYLETSLKEKTHEKKTKGIKVDFARNVSMLSKHLEKYMLLFMTLFKSNLSYHHYIIMITKMQILHRIDVAENDTF